MVTTTQNNKPKLITRPKTMISSTTVTKPSASLPSAPSSSQPTSRPQQKPSYTIYGQNSNVPTGTEAIRPFFESRGYKVDWDPTQNVVTIPGSNVAIRPDANIGGTTFANTDTLNSALKGLGYKSPQEKERDTAAKRYNDMLSEIEKMMRTPVQYDPEDDPRFQAYQDLYDAEADEASLDTMEFLNSRGLLDSSMTRSDIAQHQQKARQKAMAHVPEFYAQAQNDRNQQIRDLLSLVGLMDAEEQQMYDRDLTERQIAEDTRRYNQGVSEDTRRYNQDFAENQRRYDQNFAYQKERDTIADQQLADEKAYRSQRDSEEDRRWWAQYEREGEQFAQQMGLNWAELSQRQKEFYADEAWRQKQYDLDVQRLNTPEEAATGSLTANQFLDSMRNLYSDPVMNEFGNEVIGNEITKDPTRRKQLFDSVVFASYDDATTSQLLNALGFTNQEIERYLNQGE